MSTEVILVNLKNHQPYIIDNIKNLLLFGNDNITVITNRNLFTHFKSYEDKITLIDDADLDLGYFDDRNKQNEKFRSGFWPLTSRRLFCVYEYMKKNDKKNCFHLENDTMVYTNFAPILSNLQDNKLCITVDAPNRCIAGIMFIPKACYMAPLIDNYMYHRNDMLNLINFYVKHPGLCMPLPIMQQNKHYDKKNEFTENFDTFQAIFDAAAMGQYLGGVDPKNKRGDTRGFVNETTVVDYSKYNFAWIKKENKLLYVPHIEINNKYIPIYNLHIHCKRLSDFMADNPNERKFIPLQDSP